MSRFINDFLSLNVYMTPQQQNSHLMGKLNKKYYIIKYTADTNQVISMLFNHTYRHMKNA
jgi:hypothetical protein